MTDNFEDLEHHDVEHTEEQPPKTGVIANLGQAWRTRPLFKLLVVMVGAGAVIALAAHLFASAPKEQQSRLVNPPDVHQAPGGPGSSPYFLEQTKKAEQTRENEALKRGQSALPTPIGRDNGMNAEDKNDPLTDLRAETMRLKQQMTAMQAQQQGQQPPAQNQQQERFDESMAQAMQQQMRQFMESWAPKGIKDVTVSKEETASANGANGTNGQGANANGANGANAAGQPASPPPKVIVTAGTVSYAQLLVEANSDVPGPILAQIVSGPMSGARAVGFFQIANGYNDYLVLHFTHANLKGKDYSIDAYALDPDTTLAGLATEVDERYFTRVILPAAAGFLQGLGSAIGQSNQTTTVSGTGLAIVSQPKIGLDQGLAQGMGQAATVASQFFQNQANQTRPLVRVASGTPMGMFFISSVVDQTGATPQYPPTTMANGMGYPGMNGMNGMNGMGGYPGMNGVGGYPTGMSGYPGGYGFNPGATSVGYNGYPQSGNSSVPYPNVGMPSNSMGGYGGGYGSGGLRTYQPGYPGQGLVP